MRANDVLYTGGVLPANFGKFSPLYISTVPGLNETITININTQDISSGGLTSIYTAGAGTNGNQSLTVDAARSVNGLGIGVWMNSGTGNIDATINGTVATTGNTFTLNTQWALDGGNITVTGGPNAMLGSASTVGAGSWLLADTGSITLNGFKSIQGGTYGILVNTNGSWSGTNTGSAVNLGTTTPLGAITTRAGSGIYISQQANLTGDGTINICATDITATGGYGIYSRGWKSDTDIGISGALNSTLTGVWSLTSSGNNTISGKGTGTLKGGTWGIVADSSALADGNITVKDFVSVEATAGSGIWTLANTGTTTIDNIGSITAGTWGIYSSAIGAVNIGQVKPIGPITATTGIQVVQLYNALKNGDINIKVTDITADGGYGVITTGWEKNTTTKFSGKIDSTLTGVWSTATSGNITVDGLGTGTIKAGTWGVVADSNGLPGGNVTVKDLISVEATAGSGIWTLANTGTTTIDKIGTITAGTWGIYSSAIGAVNIGQGTRIGPITANVGIEVVQLLDAVNNGAIKINASNITADAGYGIHTLGWGQDTLINVTGTLDAAGTGIYSTASTGNITVGGNGTGIVDGGVGGVILNSGIGGSAGNVTVEDFTSVTGATTGIWLVTNQGSANVNNAGAITGKAGHGILASTLGGDVNIGNLDTNGVILGSATGIDASALAGGDITIVTDANVTGTAAWGMRTVAVNGDINIDVNAGNVTGGLRGIEASTLLGSGNIVIDIAAGSTVQGTAYGLLTASGTGTAIVNNLGTIKDTTDTGAASDAGGDAIWAYAGTNTVNNTGNITGRVHSTGSTAFTLNNLVGATWIPGIGGNLFAGVADKVANAGTILVRTGSTVFAGLETFDNLAGGHIDLGYGPGAIDDLTVVNFSAKAGSKITANFDPELPNNSGAGYDNSTNGLGTSDTIVVTGVSTPEAKSDIAIVSASADPSALAGSVSVIYTGVNKNAPTVGSHVTSSAFYKFAPSTDPTTAAVKFYLVDDGNGGVYLQWLPHLTNLSTGGFGGGTLTTDDGSGADADGTGANGGAGADGAGAGVGLNLASDKGNGNDAGGNYGSGKNGSGGASALSTAAGMLGSSLGGFGATGGPSGGGVIARLGDTTANTLMFPEDPAPCAKGEMTTAWAMGSGASTSFGSGGGGSFYGVAAGIETDMQGTFTQSCGHSAIGAFGFQNWADDSWDTGTLGSDSTGFGVYARAASESTGFYGLLMGAAAWSKNDFFNRVFQSTGDQDSLGLSAMTAIGYVLPLNKKTHLDLRAFAAYGNIGTDPFTDSRGLTVDDMDTDIFSTGVMVGAHYKIDDKNMFGARIGGKFYQVARDISIGETTISGKANGTAGSGELTYHRKLTAKTTLDLNAYADVGNGFHSIGGSVMVSYRF
jgi:hypothetical protein